MFQSANANEQIFSNCNMSKELLSILPKSERVWLECSKAKQLDCITARLHKGTELFCNSYNIPTLWDPASDFSSSARLKMERSSPQLNPNQAPVSFCIFSSWFTQMNTQDVTNSPYENAECYRYFLPRRHSAHKIVSENILTSQGNLFSWSSVEASGHSVVREEPTYRSWVSG